jgi:hypothetical protein
MNTQRAILAFALMSIVGCKPAPDLSAPESSLTGGHAQPASLQLKSAAPATQVSKMVSFTDVQNDSLEKIGLSFAKTPLRTQVKKVFYISNMASVDFTVLSFTSSKSDTSFVIEKNQQGKDGCPEDSGFVLPAGIRCSMEITFSPYKIAKVKEQFVVDFEMGESIFRQKISLSAEGYLAASVAVGKKTMNLGWASAASLTDSRTLSDPVDVAVFAGQLFVADRAQRRVLIWKDVPKNNGEKAQIVVGQKTMTDNRYQLGGPNNFSEPSALAVTQDHLIVSDKGSNRVTGWRYLTNLHMTEDSFATVGGMDFLMGQNSFDSFSAGAYENGMDAPSGVAICEQMLFVSDAKNHRILAWHQLPMGVGSEADFIIGAGEKGVGANRFHSPAGIACNDQMLALADQGNNRVLVWSGIPTKNRAADFVIGQVDMRGRSGGVGPLSLSSPAAVTIKNSRFVISDSGNNRVLIWNTLPSSNTKNPDLVFGQEDFFSSRPNSSGEGATSLRSPQGVCMDESQLYIADADNSRVLIVPLPE